VYIFVTEKFVIVYKQQPLKPSRSFKSRVQSRSSENRNRSCIFTAVKTAILTD